MGIAVNFPNNDHNTIENEIVRQNKIYLEGIRERMNHEYNALLRTNNEPAITTGKIISKMVNSIIDHTADAFNENSELNKRIHAPAFISQCMQSINAILAGGIISPLTGEDEEWVDTTVAEDVGQQFKFNYRGKEYSITIESVQVNVRYPKIYRLNNDNRLAHRIDYFQFHNATKPDNIHLTEDSIRFIQFPYTMQTLHSHCIVEDNKISDYLDFGYNEIANGLVYPDQSNDDPHSYIIAPKIPFHMLEEAGIDIEEEISAYVTEIDNSQMPDFEDDDFDNDFMDDDI